MYRVPTLCALLVACSSDPTYVDDPAAEPNDSSPDSGLGVLRFMPTESFSGFDGQHTYTIPVAVYDSADDLEVTASDPSAVAIAPKSLVKPVSDDGVADTGKYFFVTMKKAGTFTLSARSGGQTITSTVTATSYPLARYRIGETRYMSGGQGDPPCANCHVGGEAIDHSPAALSNATDEAVATVITTGITTRGRPIQTGTENGHKWRVTVEEREGLVTYLRSLAPKGFK